MLGNGCDNARKALKSRALTGSRERVMTPESTAEAMRAYTHKTNRLNWSAPKLIGIYAPRPCRVIEQSGWNHALSDG